MVVRGRTRVAFYSHDTQGLGHVRRNIELAAALTRAHRDTDVLLITGAPEAASLPLPPRTEVLVLPAVTKDRDGRYASSALGLTLPEVLRIRGRLVAAAVEAFTPDLLVVDKEARGLQGELDEALRVARRTRGPRGMRTRVVLGLRDVLDSAEVVAEEARRNRTVETVLSHYDEIWVYGDPRVFDPVTTYGMSDEVARMVRYTGYLGANRGGNLQLPGLAAEAEAPASPYVLCLVGGGQDGADLARAFARAPLPPGHHGVLVTGPYMDPATRSELEAAAAARGDLTVHAFVRSTRGLLATATAVVSMGGYNTVCEVLATGVPALLVPRTVPRLEQAIRADCLAACTHLTTVRPGPELAGALGGWLADATKRLPEPHPVDLAGLSRVPVLAEELLTAADHHTWETDHAIA